MATTFPDRPPETARLDDDGDVVEVVVLRLVVDEVVVLAVVLSAVVGSGSVLDPVVVPAAVAEVVGALLVVLGVGVTVTVVLVTGVIGMRLRPADEAAAELAGLRFGTVTWAWVEVFRAAVVRAAVVLLVAVAFSPGCPQAASSTAAMPWPATIRAVRRLREEDTSLTLTAGGGNLG